MLRVAARRPAVTTTRYRLVFRARHRGLHATPTGFGPPDIKHLVPTADAGLSSAVTEFEAAIHPRVCRENTYPLP